MSEEVTAKQREAERQIRICNACRYCEGYCSVFPAAFSMSEPDAGDITFLANLCHNCRSCHYACQYTEPHEFNLNLPNALAEVRTESWTNFVQPSGLTRLFQRHGIAAAAALTVGVAVLFLAVQFLDNRDGDGFYAYLSHSAMVSIFVPAFLLPIFAALLGVRRFWKYTHGAAIGMRTILTAVRDAADLRNLAGGHGEGCNFEHGDRFSNHRRYAHQATLYGFLLCLASTLSGSIMHYVFDLQAPYGFVSPPKLLGVPGGVLLLIGTLWLARLKLIADKNLGNRANRGSEMAFILLLAFISASGLALYAATDTALVPTLLALHLGSVLAFFLTLPYTKMVHGFFRFAALLREAQLRETTRSG